MYYLNLIINLKLAHSLKVQKNHNSEEVHSISVPFEDYKYFYEI